MNENTITAGGISGAISDPLSPEAQEHAIVYYEEIRHRTDDIMKIATYTGYTPEQVLKVKNFLFVETHILSTGIKDSMQVLRLRNHGKGYLICRNMCSRMTSC